MSRPILGLPEFIAGAVGPLKQGRDPIRVAESKFGKEDASPCDPQTPIHLRGSEKLWEPSPSAHATPTTRLETRGFVRPGVRHRSQDGAVRLEAAKFCTFMRLMTS